MDTKKSVAIFSLLVVSLLVFSVGFASAGWFSDLIGKFTSGNEVTITGNVVLNPQNITVYYNGQGITYSNTYSDPRFVIDGVDYVPWIDSDTATKWCKTYGNANNINYTSGTMYNRGGGSGDVVQFNILNNSWQTYKNQNFYTGRVQCILGNTTVPPSNITSNVTCTDSDGGLNYYVKGVVNGSDGRSATDVCVEQTELYNMFEFKCESDGRVSGSYPYNCSNGCVDGACVNTTQNQTNTTFYIDSCRQIDLQGTYILTNDIYSSGSCLIINSSNVTLDGVGYRIIGNYSSYSIGIKFSSDLRNIQLKNLYVTGFSIGLLAENSYSLYPQLPGFYISDSIFDRNGHGLWLGKNRASSNVINNVRVTYSDGRGYPSSGGGRGMSINTIDNLVITSSVVSHNGDSGIYILTGNNGFDFVNNSLVNVVAEYNGEYGGIVFSGSGGVIKDSVSNYNADAGFNIGGRNNLIQNNSATGNLPRGYQITNYGNNLTNNIARNNTIGVQIGNSVGSGGNFFISNIFCDSSEVDLLCGNTGENFANFNQFDSVSGSNCGWVEQNNYSCETIIDQSCSPIGNRFREDNSSFYCAADGNNYLQKLIQADCENNYECRSNFCSDGKCISSPAQTANLIVKIWCKVSNIFGSNDDYLSCVAEF